MSRHLARCRRRAGPALWQFLSALAAPETRRASGARGPVALAALARVAGRTTRTHRALPGDHPRQRKHRVQSIVANGGSGLEVATGAGICTAAVEPNRMHISPVKASFAKRNAPICEGAGAFSEVARS